jgi:hypothetical protein
MECDTLCSGWIIPLDVGPQGHEIVDCLGPYGRHDRVSVGVSSLLPQEATQSLTTAFDTPSPRSREAIARLMPATCHSLTFRYSLIASAARKERLRPVLLANRSNRFLTAESILTVNVVEGMAVSSRA